MAPVCSRGRSRLAASWILLFFGHIKPRVVMMVMVGDMVGGKMTGMMMLR